MREFEDVTVNFNTARERDKYHAELEAEQNPIEEPTSVIKHRKPKDLPVKFGLIKDKIITYR